MNQRAVTENEYLQRGACDKCSAKSGIGKKQYRYACIMALLLLLIGSVLSFPLCAAEPDAQKAAISAGVAAGTDISVIMQNAVAAGMTPEQAVMAIVIAGADPGRVVYEAIAAKYLDKDVVKGVAAAVHQLYCADTSVTATTCSAQVSTIVSAAQQAGVSADQINGFLADAGTPATVVASANTQSSQNPAPAEGYTAPVAAAPLTAAIGGGSGPIGGGGGAPIGGSGVGAPQTKAASPHKP